MTAGSTANLLGAEEGLTLLRIARASLEHYLEVDAPRAPDVAEGTTGRGEAGGPRVTGPPAVPSSGPLAEPRGVFVTLTRAGELRGCTGYSEPHKPVAEAVRDLAISSAARDTRFSPVRPEELAEIHIEVSVLTPLHPIDPAEVVIGRHGLVARRRGRTGLLLPQVAPEWGWDVPQFLAHTCKKAGLPPDAWRDPECELLAFEAQIFDE